MVIGGVFEGHYDIDPGPLEYTINASPEVLGVSHNIFLIKYNVDGDLIWGFDLNNGGEQYLLSDIEINEEGEIYGVGYLSTTCDFDPGADTEYIGVHDGYAASFIVKFSALGELIWVKATEREEVAVAYGRSLVLDPDGNVYVTGNYSGDIDFVSGDGEVYIDPYGGENRGGFVEKNQR